ncbi:MAG: transcription repressor NadR [Lachnospiraceae bacterium]|nr:transcription repressor NadR [Lachnospiraceae bacterium]MBP3475647.1 transcription repressor NadR [Lachnospiraceae bacterium]
MEGDTRRKKIIEILQQESRPISGSEIAKRVGVSRQVIVQDIALLRTSYENIFSTNRGYLLYERDSKPECARRVVKVKHQKEDIVRELDIVVDAGGQVINVIVEHEIYGPLTGDLMVRNRADVRNFMRRVEEYQTKPLTDLTGGVHFHTIEAENEETLDEIVKQWKEAGFLTE